LGVIRLILAMSVVVWHLWGHALSFTVNGYEGVLLFFIISGFYMSMVINDKYSKESIYKFYLARALRIYPIYLVVLVIIVSFLQIIGKPLLSPPTTGEWLFSALTNITLIGIPWLRDADWLAIPPAWSLAAELQFYIIAPFILPRRLWIVLLVLLGLTALRLSYLDQPFAPWRYTMLRSDWCFFMLGAVAHRVGLLVTDSQMRKTLGWTAAGLLPVAGIFCGLPTVKDLDAPELWFFYLLFAAAIPFIFSISKRSRIDRFLGNLSYPIYIAHWLVIALLEYFSGSIHRFLPSNYHLEINAAVVICAAALLHFTVEAPIEKIRQRFSSPSKPILPTPSVAYYDASRAAAPAE
jgi:peptidoglycan/LPS O-acetylase OafA/YrhL